MRVGYRSVLRDVLAILLVSALPAFASAQWTVINLNPAGATDSIAYGVQGGQQVGSALVGGVNQAMLWRGTAASWVSLHPAGASDSVAFGVDTGQQVGHVNPNFGRSSRHPAERDGRLVGEPGARRRLRL